MQRITILGATGSIGQSTLDVVGRHPDRFEVFALTAHRQDDKLVEPCLRFRPRHAVVGSPEAAQRLAAALRARGCPTEVLHGEAALEGVASAADVDMVMAAIVGAAGLKPTLAAARAGKKVLLANKEALVLSGAIFMRAVADSGAQLLPIDSEHNAVFQALPQGYAREPSPAGVRRILLTASGGPFRETPLANLEAVTPEQACAHPNWVMGRKISVDSATMMNKALEVIEARWLFDLEPEQIRVVIHPQSIIHSMVVCRDRSTLAQLGTPDMRVPIAYGLSFPRRIESGAQGLDFGSLRDLTFEVADLQRYPGLGLAWQCLRDADGSTAVLNAANEVAVAAFLDREVRFDQIHEVNVATLEAVAPQPQDLQSLESLLALDERARRHARRRVEGMRP